MNLLNILKPARALALSVALFGVAAVWSQATYAEVQTKNVSQAASAYQTFLKNEYSLTLSPSLTKGEFIQAVDQILNLEPQELKGKFTYIVKDSPYYRAVQALFEKGILTDSELQPDQALTELDATFIAVKASGLKELAYTYSDQKIETALEKVQIDYSHHSSLSKQAAQELAVAVDTGILSSDAANQFQPGKPANADFASLLLGKILTFHGSYKQAIGQVADADIFSKLTQSWKTLDIIKAPELRAVFDEALKQNLVTGYNLKDNRYDAHFDPQLALTYGHSDFNHAIQLIGLLRSENINAKVQLEPKTSAFIYLKEWGEPIQTNDYQVLQIDNGNYIAYAKEYDISFEFTTVDQKNKFQDIIFAYAKKDSEDETGLIASSWWQPLYYSLTDIKDYEVIANNKITQGNYYAQSFTLPERITAIKEGINKINPSLDIASYTFWVDKPFYNYLLGDFK
ncbi:hypothetical protein D3C73_570360 [compost metagenome]